MISDGSAARDAAEPLIAGRKLRRLRAITATDHTGLVARALQQFAQRNQISDFADLA